MVTLVHALLLSADKKRATQLWIHREDARPVVSFELDGTWCEELVLPPELYPAAIRRLGVMASLPSYDRDQYAAGRDRAAGRAAHARVRDPGARPRRRARGPAPAAALSVPAAPPCIGVFAADVCLAAARAEGSDRGMRLPYRILNVFTVAGDRLSGNPLCVFEDGSGLTETQMQALARQLNLSETTFILPSQTATARVRIFTPGFEMPFAGHPTLGTAHVVRALRGGGDSLVLEMQAGLVPVTAEVDRWTLRAARPATSTPPTASPLEIARMVGLDEEALAGAPLWVNTGAEQLVIPVKTVDHVRRAAPVAAMIQQWGFQPGGREAMAYLWAREAEAQDRLVVRFFFTQHGAVIEDPATGSACANLGGYLLVTGSALPIAASLRQGEAVGRPSQLELRVDADRGIHVSGNVVELGGGSFDI